MTAGYAKIPALTPIETASPWFHCMGISEGRPGYETRLMARLRKKRIFQVLRLLKTRSSPAKSYRNTERLLSQ